MDNNSALLSGDEKIAQILQRYSHLFVECDNDHVQDFYFLISLYLAKCDGLLSITEIRKLESATREFVGFSAQVKPVCDKELILERLSFLKRHNVNKPDEIMRVLTRCNLPLGNIVPSDRRYLIEFTGNPGKAFKWYASRLNLSVSSVTRAYQRLRKAIHFQFYSYVNYPLFKLKHFVVFFKPNNSFKNTMISRRGFACTLNSDTFGEWKWASFLVPDQDRILIEFKSGLKGLADEVFDDRRLYEIKLCGWQCNLFMFDGEKWCFNNESFGIRAFEYAKTHSDVLPHLKEFMYGEEPIHFDQVDFLLSTELFSGQAKSRELSIMLREQGCGEFSPVTVSKKLAKLRQSGVFFPVCNFRGLGLDSMSAFAAECSEQTLDVLYNMFPMFPECWVNRTNKGVVCFLMFPDDMASAISYILQGLEKDVDDLISTTRFSNLGGRLNQSLVRHWNVEKQRWDFERGFFDLSNYSSN